MTFLPRLLLIDRYVLRQVIVWYAIVVGVVMFLLCIETTPRLLVQLAGIREGPSLVARSLASLLPEYVAIALPIGLFLGTALTFRRLATAGELEVFAASGIWEWPDSSWGQRCLESSPVRCSSASGAIYSQPASGDSMRSAWPCGQASSAIRSSRAYRTGLAAKVSSISRELTARPAEFEDVVVNHGGMTAIANSATLNVSADDHFVLALHDVTAFWGSLAGDPRVLRFRFLRLAIPVPDEQRPPKQAPRDRLDRFSLGQLLHFDRTQHGSAELNVAMAHASASARAAAAILCCILPLLGFVHGVPPKRSHAAIGLGVGIVEIILFWRISALIEDRFTPVAPAAHAALVAFYAIVAFQMMRFQRRAGLGAVEQALIHTMRYARWSVMGVIGRRKRVEGDRPV